MDDVGVLVGQVADELQRAPSPGDGPRDQLLGGSGRRRRNGVGLVPRDLRRARRGNPSYPSLPATADHSPSRPRIGAPKPVQTNAGLCFSTNASSVMGGRPLSFSTRSFVPAKIPFW